MTDLTPQAVVMRLAEISRMLDACKDELARSDEEAVRVAGTSRTRRSEPCGHASRSSATRSRSAAACPLPSERSGR